jgi:hypothetical protein
LDGLDDDLEDLAHPFLAKRFAQEGKNVLLLSMTSWPWGLGLGGEVSLIELRIFEEKRVSTMMISPRCLTYGLGSPLHASPTPMTSSKWQNVP